ncbi:MAG: DUF58 domain-containing protein [Ignavibacteriales bacterium CG_4_9_14_3_um_filter_34_10]|nr:MAG: DUF58 domain-containing protein [Ignavibacteriales bacterium CG_4_9_14_3_um_filter_34_10]
MTTRELLKQVRKIEIRTRGFVNDLFSGEYHSVFKGRGMDFNEVREYQVGDEVRAIDWNVTARLGHPYVKVFEEERELTVILLVDLSSSLIFGTIEKTKQQIAAEISAILSFSALKNNDKVGLILFTDKIEKFIPPRKGKSHVLRIIRELLSFETQNKGTNIRTALEYFYHIQMKKSIVFLISDFIDYNYEKIMGIVSRRHDLIAVRLIDPKENEIPQIGLVRLKDNESNSVRYIDTEDRKFRNHFRNKKEELENFIKQTFMKAKVDSINIDLSRSYIKPIVDFFKLREKRI